jgi:hypothetical protein
MITVRCTNVNTGYVKGLHELAMLHVRVPSRNGPVLQMPEAFATHYAKPVERVLFDAQRDANPFFHLVEALWMLDGHCTVAPLDYYVPRMKDFSDDDLTFHGAYGHRWRHAFGTDQIATVIAMLRSDATTRRAVITMWDAESDLNVASKDLPCNLVVSVQREGTRLNMCVYNRSNDAIMGHYGANVVHFSLLQEYLALMVGCNVGWYEQVTANLHAYERDWNRYWPLVERFPFNRYDSIANGRRVFAKRLITTPETFDSECTNFMDTLTRFHEVTSWNSNAHHYANPFLSHVAAPMTEAYKAYRDEDIPRALGVLNEARQFDGSVDWLIAGIEWLERRALHRQVRSVTRTPMTPTTND